MTKTLSNCRILDPETNRDERGGISFTDGIITDIGPHLFEADDGIDCGGNCVAPGLIDLRVKTGEPGNEHRETLASASRSAVAGGITSMVIMPDTSPTIDTPALVDFLKRAGTSSSRILNKIYPAGALSQSCAGEKMTELGLMKEAGAILFSNGDFPIQSSALMRRILQYAEGLSVRVMLRPDELNIASGSMNAGAFATRLGLKGRHVTAEWLGLTRDLLLAEMTKAPVIVDQVSTSRSLDLIDQSKSIGQDIASTVAAHSLFFNELDIGDGTHDDRKAYLTYCKVNPPFRSEQDRLALINGLKEGRIDCVVSAHDPQPPEEKRLPFDEASFGAAGLETLLSCLTSLCADEAYELDLLTALRSITLNPANLLDLPQGRLKIGAPADIICFDPNAPWKCKRENLRSYSKNSPFDGRLLTGRVKKTYVNGALVFQMDEET